MIVLSLQKDSFMLSDWKLIIDSLETLKEAGKYYHDQNFDLDNIIFDKEKGIFSVEYWQVLFEEAHTVRDYFFIQILLAPMIRTRIIFKYVIDMKINDAEPDDIFVEMIFNDQKKELVINCAKSTKIILSVDKLEGTLVNIGTKIPDAYKFSTLLYTIISTGPALWPRDQKIK